MSNQEFYDYGNDQLPPEALADRTPPQNWEMEQAVLGAIMLQPDYAMPLVLPLLTREDFYLDGHGIIFELASELHQRGIPPDAMAMVDELKAREQMDRVGGSAVVMGMINMVATAANVEHHAKKVAEKAKLRRIITTCTEVIDECYRQELDAQHVSNRLYASAVEHQVDGPEENVISISHARDEFYLQQSQPLPAIPTGFPMMDKVMRGGLAKGQMHTVIGLTSHGKTAMLLNLLTNIACGQGVPCLLFSIEMDRRQIFERLVTGMTLQCRQADYHMVTEYRGVNNYKLRGIKDGRLPDDAMQEMLQAAEQNLTSSPVHVIDSGYMTPNRLRKAVLRFARKHRDFVVFIDYYQILEGDERGMRKVEKLQVASNAIRQLAREINMPIVMAAQARRDFNKSRPTMYDVEWCNQVSQDSFTCMVVDQPHMRNDKSQNTEIAQLPADVNTFPVSRLYLDKNRNGQAGVMLQYHYVGPVTRFVELQPDGRPELGMDWTMPMSTGE